MAHLDDLYKEAGIKPGSPTPMGSGHGMQSPLNKPPGKSGGLKIISIVTALVFIGIIANIVSNKNFFDFGNGFRFKVWYIIIPIFALNFLIRFFVKQIKKNKNVESYKGQS